MLTVNSSLIRRASSKRERALAPHQSLSYHQYARRVALCLHVTTVDKTAKEKPQKLVKDDYERAVRESDGYRTA